MGLTLDKKNKVWNLFLLFLCWPIISVGFSITLYLFLFLWNKSWNLPAKEVGYKRSTERPFWGLMVIFILSVVSIPDTINTSLLAITKALVQHIYWVIVAVFIMRNSQKISVKNISRIAFYGLILLTITFFFLQNTPFRNTPIFNLRISRNGFVYISLVFYPFFLTHVRNHFRTRIFNLVSLLGPIIFLLTEGRAGALLGVLETILILAMYNSRLVKAWGVIGVFFAIILMLSPYNIDDSRKVFGNVVRPLSERVADFIVGTDDGSDLSQDRSWLTRQLMIEKGLEIFRQYPFFGIGPFNFTKYKANLVQFSSDDKFARLKHRLISNDTDLNTTSAHNAYIQILCEYGVFGFLVVIHILFRSNYLLIKDLIKGNLNELDLPRISVLAISIHFFVISNFTGTLTFFIIGLALANQSTLNFQNSQSQR